MPLKDKHILIGIGGGIAVYRVAELARLLVRQGASVRCIMTRSAQEFVTPLTFEALTGEEVHTELFDLTNEREMGHIRLARWADAIVIAPATANLLTKFAWGVADDLLTTLYQANEAPVLVAPAMNHTMWESGATQANVRTLTERGIRFIGPASGELACGEEGAGRLSEPEAIADALLPLLLTQQLAGQRWVINAGPTVEAWDDVRILTNRATGRLGSELATLASAMGADVTLVAGPGTPAASARVARSDVESAEEMLASCKEAAAGCNTFVATAAVSDFRFAEKIEGKLKRGDTQAMQVEIAANADIVADIAAMEKRPQFVVAFAAEATDHVEEASRKLAAKGADAIIANDISNMGSDMAGGWFVTGKDAREIHVAPKAEFAEHIIRFITEQTS